MVYGTEAGIMALAYGGSKSTTPAIVSTANQNATSIINGYLNLTEDLTSPPQIVVDACNWIASKFVENPRTDPKDCLEMADILLGTIKDQLSQSETSRWANMRFV